MTPGPTRDSAASLEACFADLRAPAHGFIDDQRFTSEDGHLELRRARQPGTRPAVGETFAYDLIRFGLRDDRGVICSARRRPRLSVRAPQLGDVVEARAGAELFRVRETRHDFDSWSFTFWVVDPATHGLLQGPVLLRDGGCRTLPFDLNGCPGRMRTDRP